MLEIHPYLHVGSAHDYESTVRHFVNWRVVHACKEPYHRQALNYAGRAAPKNHPEYLIARRGPQLILNLVDAPDPAYIHKSIVDAALDFIHQAVQNKTNVLVHCNEGMSRGPTIAMLYLIARTDRFVGQDFDATFDSFRKMYPSFNPAAGMLGFAKMNFVTYCGQTDQ